jgi:hydrogenase maturation protein HypF
MTRVEVRVEGIVQGVGFRPFVYGLATRLGLSGWVANDARGVVLEVEGREGDIGAFLAALESEAPPLARIDEVAHRPIALREEAGFRIAPSERGASRATLVSPDVATCDDCLRELADPTDRRFHYAFINCTNCGPRFTIVRDVPYDRPFTTMADFAMCEACGGEYHDPADRRFHAQPVACARCGPRLDLDLVEAARLLRSGKIVAIKGLGGWHLAANAADEAACATLRARKHREEKPFAVMVRDLASARQVATLRDEEETLLRSPARPIVLVERRPDALLADSVAPGNRSLGIMLPYTPLHHLLMAEMENPVVLTSGNLSDEPIAYRDDDARDRLQSIADAFLGHDRPIHIRTDDSVVRVFRGKTMPLRRSRGYVPRPLRLPLEVPPLLACGGELKNTVCLARGTRAFVSHHIGDLESLAAHDSFREAIDHFQRLFDIRPGLVAHDLHPEYLSTKWAEDAEGIERIGVQHHHAHVASCLVDNGERGPAIGVAFDGLGYGSDGTLWGGEVLIADLISFDRFAHLPVVPMPGGAMAIRQPWRMAAMWLDEEVDLPVRHRNEARWETIRAVGRSSLAPRTSSMGRLFDALAAILDVRDRVAYEGQAAIELEQMADRSEEGSYPAALTADGLLDGASIVRAVVDDIRHGVDRRRVAARIHRAVADLVVAACLVARERTSLGTVALSGGVFQNLLLLGHAVEGLERNGFRVLWHTQVPCNDGGLSLGQAAIAGALAGR